MMRWQWANPLTLIAALLLNTALLSACGGGPASVVSTQSYASNTASSSVTSANSSNASASAISSGTAAVATPAISGDGTATVTAGTAYSFTPTVAAAGAVTFSIGNQPSWASFNPATGQLSGTPTTADIGTYAKVTLTVSSGGLSANLAGFTITVAAAPVQSGTALLNWTPPTQNTDGSLLDNLAGYFIYFGNSPMALNSRIQVNNAGLTSYSVTGLPRGTTYFAISAYTASSVESALSNVGSKFI
jgi:hypothetical protein